MAIGVHTAQHLPNDPDAPAELENVFLYFWNKFSPLAIPRSVAEAQIKQSELDFLVRWFSALYGKPRNWCERDWQDDLTEQVSASRREMFGSLFLILAGEVCRDQCNEDALWPSIAAILRRDKNTYPLLFAGGQPTVMTKTAIIAGARRLGLRNLIDRYGTQEYFDTIKLQFGFTHKGALSRLPEWLDGLSTPIAVNILKGDESEYEDLRSESFCKLWKLLLNFRRGRVSAFDLSAQLRDSPWIRPSWISELVSIVEKRPISVPPDQAGSDTASDYREDICEPRIEWLTSVRPRLVLRLNEERVSELLADADSAAFAVDGRITARWTAHEGSWIGPKTIPCDPDGVGGKPNFSPKMLSISSGEGKPIAEVDLTELELGEPFKIFDSESGSVVSSSARLDLRRDYSLVCDSNLSLTGCYPLSAKGRSIYKLTGPWDPEVKLLWNGILHWEPKISDASVSPPRMILSNPEGKVTNIDTDSPLILRNVPGDVDFAYVVVGSREYEARKTGLDWETTNRVPITLKMALGEERIRVRLVRGENMRSSSPRIAIRLNGLAIIDVHSEDDPRREWSLVNGRRPLNIAGGSSRARIFSDSPRPYLYEGPRFVKRLDVKGLSLRDLWGWGWPLMLRSSEGDETTLVDSIQDRGCISIYFGTLLGRPVDRLHLRIPVEPSPDHSVLAWPSFDSTPIRISADQIRPEDHNYVWKLPSLGPFVAIALSYKGVWLGSSAKAASVVNALVRTPTARLFSLIRWLKLPVISSDLCDSMKKAAVQAPTEFVRGWLGNEPPARGLTHRQSDPSVESILRWFLWEYADSSELRLDKIGAELIAPSARNETNEFLSRLGKLCELCPALAYNFARAKVRGSKYWQYARRVIAQLLTLPQQATLSELQNRIVGMSHQCSEASRITSEGLIEAVELYRCRLDNGKPLKSEMESRIRRLGELSIGREYLATSLIVRLLEQRNP